MPRLLRDVLLHLGIVGSIVLVLYAGRRNPSFFLMVLFVGWVCLPFLLAALASEKAEPWGAKARAIVDGGIVVVTIGSLSVYTAVALGPPRPKPASFFLLVPPASVLLMAAVFFLARTAGSKRPT